MNSPRAGLSLELENPPPEIEISIEPPRLSRVFYNLVHNAMDEMPAGGKITLRFTVNDVELLVEMTDTGKGIAPEILPQLFQPFATHGKAQGTGLGLSICKRIIEDHGGPHLGAQQSGPGRHVLLRASFAKIGVTDCLSASASEL